MSDSALRIEGLSKLYRIGQRTQHTGFRDVVTDALAAPFRRRSAVPAHSSPDKTGSRTGQPETLWALKDVSFDVKRGDVIGIVGRNGAGKSTMLKILSRITKPTEGRAEVSGRMGSLLEVGTGFHPELTGRENIFLNGIILGMKRAEIARKFDEIVAFSAVEKFLDTPVKRYSSGMYVRLAFAVAAHLEPEILVVDEVLAVGDAAFQKKCLGKLGEVAKEGRTVLFVSHNMNAIQRLCSKSILLEGGRLSAYSTTADIVNRYLNSGIQSIEPTCWLDMSQLNRAGTGQALVNEIWFSSRNQAVANRPYPNGPLDVKLAIHSDAKRTIGSIAITIYDKYGTKLINADTIALGKTVELCEGRNVIGFSIKNLHLTPGAYVLGWWLGDLIGSEFDYVDSAVNLEVIDLEAEGLGIRPEADGAVTCSFEVSEE